MKINNIINTKDIMFKKDTYYLIIMGFLGDGLTPEEREQKFIEKALDEFNPLNGFECEVMLPEKQLKISGSSGTKKGLATFAFGIIGWAATSGTSQNEENRIITTIFQVVDNGIVFKNGAIDGSDIRISFNEIIKMEVIKPKNQEIVGAISLLKNKLIIINPKIGPIRGRAVLNQTSDIINEHACGAQYEEVGWGLEHAKGQLSDSEIIQNINSLMENLKLLNNMHEKGLLTNDEFNIIKQRLMNIDDISKKYCKECGSKLSDDSVFCTNCGSKLDK